MHGYHMFELSDDEMKRLSAEVRERHGQFLTFARFADVVLSLFEDIPGLECLPDTAANPLLHQLWTIYHDEGHYQEVRTRIRCDH